MVSYQNHRADMAGVEGLEPSRTVLETGMLPLHHTPIFTFYIGGPSVEASQKLPLADFAASSPFQEAERKVRALIG